MAAVVRVLVVHPPVAIARDFVDYPYFADLGAVQLAAVLRKRGHEVALIDAYALPGSTLVFRKDGRGHLGAPLDELLQAIERERDADAAVVAYTPFHRPPHRDPLLAGLLRGMRAMIGDAPVLLADAYQSGQHYVESDGVLAAYPEADAWVKYEAELTVPALLEAAVRPRGAHRGASVVDLDALPDPAWDLLDLDAHDIFRQRVVAAAGRARWSFPIDGRTLPAITSRGCPFRCAHCSSNPGRARGAPKTQVRQSPERMRAALGALVRAHGATRIEVLDELVNVRASHFDGLLTIVEELDVAIDVPNGFRADYLRREQIARLRGRATTISISAESGVPRVVDEIVGKELELGEIERVAREARVERVPLMIHFIIGLPGETGEEINGTLAYALDLFDRFAAEPAVQFATPLPGTRLAEGRALPVIEDWGPAFQTMPSQPGALPPATLRSFARTLERRLAASRGPEKLIVNLTYACNNHCTFCAVGTRTQVHASTARIDEWLALYRSRGVRLVDFDGGEPTLHPDLFAITARARTLGYERVHVTTNGRLAAYPDFAERLIGSGVTSIAFSVHGADARTHAQQVGVAEAFDQTIAGIRSCVERARGAVELGMNTTLTKGNTAQLPAIAELAWDLGLRWLNVQFLTPFGRATKWVAPDIAEAARITGQVIDAWAPRGMRIQVINLPFCLLPGHEEQTEGDLSKLARHMVFVNNESVNLAQYLAERRVRKPVCGACPHATF
jgi:MoaA/NifB/PqqE/SkfB family radical SAM enzyme